MSKEFIALCAAVKSEVPSMTGPLHLAYDNAMHVLALPESKTVPFDDFKKLAKYFLRSMEGDDWHVDEAYAFLFEHGLVDEDGFEVYEDEE